MRLKRYLQDAAEFGVAFAAKSRIYNYIKAYEPYHKVIMEYLENEYKSQIEYYKNCDSMLLPTSKPAEKVIWVFWWGGIEQMPELVKGCYRSIREHAGACNVVLLSKENLQQYVAIPTHILKKFKEGIISVTHFSDIIRMHLLRDYGGIWMDATIFLSGTVPDSWLESLFYTCKTRDGSLKFASQGRWSGYFMAAGYTNMLLFVFLCDICEIYWKKQSNMISYFLLDYLIAVAYENFLPVRTVIDQLPENNTNKKWFSSHLNDFYDDTQWQRICQNTCVHKLSWKKEIIKTEGEKTYYEQILLPYCNL